MALPDPGVLPRDPIYGMFPGSARLHMDAVPLDFHRLWERTLAVKGAKVVALRKSRKEICKRFATLVYICRAEGVQPPPILVLKGVPSRSEEIVKGKVITRINTRKPASSRLKPELKEYEEGTWVYFDPKFRTSLPVLLNILEDLKRWLALHGEPSAVVLGLDNLREFTPVPRGC